MNDTIESAHPMIASDRVEGTLVYNRAGERLGRVERSWSTRSRAMPNMR